MENPHYRRALKARIILPITLVLFVVALISDQDSLLPAIWFMWLIGIAFVVVYAASIGMLGRYLMSRLADSKE